MIIIEFFGPSGSGKSYFRKRLVKNFRFKILDYKSVYNLISDRSLLSKLFYSFIKLPYLQKIKNNFFIGKIKKKIFGLIEIKKLEYKKYKDVSFVHIQSKDKMQNDDDQLLDTLGFDTGIEVDEASLVFVPNSSTIEFDDNGNVESYSAAHDIIVGNRKLEIHKVWHKPILTKRDMVECIRSKVFYKARVKLPEVIGEIESDIWITK